MSLYQRPDSDVWWVNIAVPGHPRLRRSTGTSDRFEAQRIHDEIKAGLWSVPKVKNRQRWGDAVLAWTAVEDRSESELLSLRKLGTKFGDPWLDQITGGMVESALAFCQTAGTYMRYRTMIMAILNLAVKRGWLKEVPDVPVRRDKKKKTRIWITPDQWERLYAALPAHLKAPAVLALNTGLRQANVFGLRWRDVDLERRLITVHAEDTKNDDDLAVPLNDAAVATLQAQAGVHPEFVFAFRGKPILKPKTGFSNACVAAGVPDFTWHGFRHTWATWHVQNGTPLGVLQKLGGWADLRMVMNYAKFSADFVAEFVNNVRRKP